MSINYLGPRNLFDGIIEAPLSEDEIKKALEEGKRVTEYDEQILKWHFRHDGLDSATAHGIGILGEDAFEDYLNTLGLEKDRDYVKNEPFVSQYRDIKQDFVIRGATVGVKTTLIESLDKIFRYDSFLYPAKSQEGESRRVLEYPDFLIRAAVSLEAQRCWLIGFVPRIAIESSPIAEIRGKPAHEISIFEFQSMSELIHSLDAMKHTYHWKELPELWEMDFLPEILAYP